MKIMSDRKVKRKTYKKFNNLKETILENIGKKLKTDIKGLTSSKTIPKLHSIGDENLKKLVTMKRKKPNWVNSIMKKLTEK
jgi:hypothetical protein